MPGPRGKQRTTKKPKQRTTSQGASGGAISFEPLIEDIDGAEEWNAVARILCDYLELPGKSSTCYPSLETPDPPVRPH
jgi:hypothetical protein